MQDFISFLITPLLTAPDKLTVNVTSSAVILRVDPADMGRIIGKHGNIISALRNLVRLYCATHNLSPLLLNLAES